jgi:DNA-binding transcriptional ArsR family regulator
VSEIQEMKDPRALVALAHPARLRLMEELTLSGPATATELGERVGESPANCSWHLRQLARYGFVEEAGGGVGRQRPWRIRPVVRTWGRSDHDPELNLAGDAASDMILDREVAALRAWERQRREEDPAWRQAAFVINSVAWLTLDELGELNRHITELLTRHTERLDPDQRPPGVRPVRLTAWGVPARVQGSVESGQTDA